LLNFLCELYFLKLNIYQLPFQVIYILAYFNKILKPYLLTVYVTVDFIGLIHFYWITE